MIAGKLDRRITFEERQAVQNATYGTQEITWHDVATVWAEVQDILPSRAEGVESNINLSRRPCRVRIRFREDLTSDMRIDFNGRKLRIVSGPVEMGRREGLELVAEELTTEGVAP